MTTPVLYQLPPMCGLLSLSPYCVKVQLAFTLKHVPFTIVNTLFPRQNPRNKVPFVVWDDRKLEDSTAIVEAIDAAGEGAKLIPADPAGRGEADILEDWADESLYWHGVLAKFHDDGTWARLKPEFAASFPALMRLVGPTVARRQTLAKLDSQGLTRREPALVARELGRHLDSLESRLRDRPWLVGGAISIADVAVTAMLSQLHEKLAPGPAAEIARRHKLSAMMKRVFAAAAPLKYPGAGNAPS
jgi:glutathione S-transferase